MRVCCGDFSAINCWEIFLTRLVEGSGFIWWSWDLNLQHDLGGPVKVDSSFWTIGEFLCCLFICCSLLSPSSSQYSLMSEKLVFRCLMKICIRTFWLTDLVCVEDRIMHVTLQKRQKGEPWPSAIAGHGNLDAFTADQEQRRLMLERFQEEVCTENFVLFLLHPKPCFLNLSQSASSPSLLPIPSRNTTENSGCRFCRMGLPEILGFDYYRLFWILISYVHVLDVQHPGFDFSQAQFTGNVPNPSTFLGGIKQ